ncbi:MAG: peptidoglycan DD-metalloendopeptidase family protein [Synergistetes bacterium]|nr:peptidoglycan DD-metalloendopeptidase family protein [Synergistota bacterium]MCX8127368.1 peptidoglycan DD-metalloendopeptidase family protein [Synergistota bacterium]MDW8192232.1 peptidoglycan DD-metalloendopeptidase family protein [Synergistota bacterium]
MLFRGFWGRLLLNRSLFLYIFFSLFLFSSIVSALDYDREIAEKQKLLDRIKKQLEEQERLIKTRAQREESLLEEIGKLDKEIEKLTLETKITSLKIDKLNAEINEKKKLIEKLLAELESKRELLASRVQAMYRYGRAGYLEALLRASSWESLALNSLYLRRIASYEASLIEEIERREREVSREKLELEKKLRELVALREKLKGEIASLNRKKSEREALLNKVRQEKAFYQKAYAEFEELSRQLEVTIRKLIADREAASLRRSGEISGFRLGQRRIRMIWPVSGKIVSSYGYRVHPQFGTRDFHAGIDIEAPLGTAVKAAAGGEVIFAGWLKGYGRVVIILHEGGVASVYAHLNDIVVNERDRVSQGQVIGSVGNTGLTTGAHLHFEVRVDGRTVDPLAYLPR